MTRKAIQISCNQYGTMALCDDGSMWWLSAGSQEWTEAPSIAQPKKRANLDDLDKDILVQLSQASETVRNAFYYWYGR